MPQKRVNVGGTSGGLGEFVIGLVLVVIGFYMIFTNTTVFTSFWSLYGTSLLGPLIILFMVGLMILFSNAHSWLGGILCWGSLVAMVVGILMNLHFHFKSLTLLSALVMFGLPAIGCGMILRSFRAHNVADD